MGVLREIWDGMKSIIHKQDFKKMSREQEWSLVEQKKKKKSSNYKIQQKV